VGLKSHEGPERSQHPLRLNRTSVGLK